MRPMIVEASKMKRNTSLVVCCTVLLMPLVALAYPNARQELLAALRAISDATDLRCGRWATA